MLEHGMTSASDPFDFPTMSRALILGDRETVARKTREGLDLSMDPKELIFKGLIPGMDVVGEKFRRNEYYVPQVLLSGLIFPLESMAAGVRWIGYLLPLTYFNQISRGVMLKGSPLAAVSLPLALLAVLGLVVFGLAVLRFRADLAPSGRAVVEVPV